MVGRVDAWERALARNLARSPTRSDEWLYRHGVNAQTTTYVVGGMAVAFSLGNFLWMGWAMVRDMGPPRSAAVIARVLVVAEVALLVLGAFWALFHRRGFARPGGAAILASGFVWPWTIMDCFGVVDAGFGGAEWLRLLPETLLLSVWALVCAFVLSFGTRLLARIELEERGWQAPSALALRLELQALTEVALPELGPETADTGVRLAPCRLTDFDRHRWCAYPFYGMVLFSLWRIVDRLCFKPPVPLNWEEGLLVVLGNALTPAIYGLVLLWPLRGADLRRVWTHLRSKYPNECPWCRYDVRACTTPLCTECGRPISHYDRNSPATKKWLGAWPMPTGKITGIVSGGMDSPETRFSSP